MHFVSVTQLSVASVLLLIAAALGLRTRGFLARAVQTTGVITRLEERSIASAEEGGPYFYPHFEYRTSEGVLETRVSSIGGSPARFKVGETVGVLYDPARPAEGRIASVFQLWGGTIVCGSIALIFLLVGGIFLIVSRAPGVPR